MQFLVIEPNETEAHVLSFAAGRRGHKVLTASSLDEVPRQLPFEPSAAIVGLAGLEPCDLASLAPLRALDSAMPVVVVVEDPQCSAVAALESGIGDVIRKPYHPVEVLVRAERLVSERRQYAPPSELVRVGDLEVDLGQYTATKNGKSLPLTKLELRLLYSLASHHGRVSPTGTLMDFGWESVDPPSESLLKTHISHLRKKLSGAGGMPAMIRSRHSLGYILWVGEEARAATAS